MPRVDLRQHPPASPLPEPLGERHEHQRGAEGEEDGSDDIAGPVRAIVDARVADERREPEAPRRASPEKAERDDRNFLSRRQRRVPTCRVAWNARFLPI